MEHVTKIMPILWSFIESNKKCSVGIATINNKITITFLWGKLRFKRFSNHDAEVLDHQIKNYLEAL